MTGAGGSSDLLRRLIEAGTPADLIADIADALADARAAQRILETRRAKDRARKSVPRNSTEAAESAEIQTDPFLDKETSPRPPKEINPTPCVDNPRARSRFPTPEGVTDEQFRAFRQQRKKTLTERGYTLLCNKLKALAEAGWPPGEMIDLAIERGWETVFEPKDSQHGRPQQPIRGSRPSAALALRERGAAREAAESAGENGTPGWGAWPSLPSLSSG